MGEWLETFGKRGSVAFYYRVGHKYYVLNDLSSSFFRLASATFAGLDSMVNRTFVPMCLMIALSILALFGSYSHLQPRFEDEDDD